MPALRGRPGDRPRHLRHQGGRRRPRSGRRRLGGGVVAPELRPGRLRRAGSAALLDSVLDAGRAAVAEAERTGRGGGPGQPGRDRPGLGPGHRRAPEPARRLAGPSLCRPLRRAERPRRRGWRLSPGLSLDPYFAAPKMAWLRAQGHRGGVVTTSDAWLVHQLTGAFVTDASTASRTLLLDLDTVGWSPEALAVFELADEAAPRGRRLREPRRRDLGVRRSRPAHRTGRRPAGCALRRGLPRAGLGEVHVRHRGLPARPRGVRSAPFVRRAADLGRLAGGRRDRLLPRRAGLHRGLGRPLAHRPRRHLRRRRPRPARFDGGRRRAGSSSSRPSPGSARRGGSPRPRAR